MNKLYLRKVDKNSYLPKRTTFTYKQAQKQEKLLELYEKLATHRYIVIHNLLDDIIRLKEGPNKSLAVDIDYILSDLDDYENGDIKITNEILKLKELENEKE